MKFSIHQASHIGNRKYNQDRAAYAYSSEVLLLVLADGMGGHLHGEVAAELIVDTFVESFGRSAHPRIADPDGFVLETMRHANERILKVAHDKDLGGSPGSTCVAALIQDGKVYWGHAGDSRFYLLRDGAVLVKTRDHSMVQQWLEWGMVTAEEARIHPQRNQITNCLGGVEDLFYMEQGKPIALQSGDTLLLGSDGLWGPFTDEELAVAFAAKPVAQVLDSLITSALERENGHSDNATGIAIRWGKNEADHDTDQLVCHILEVA
ncbi:PP2C family protein-serine/threonine phosphatase [Candidatus Ferrigenium straubiae]|jgi:serine/threonine protein phosphatase PrpC|uniref:PP2C family protein-serine/threonine phosphatase n=1 Tax=Candidatus Ferrigenium straubiae TaxID=2919506 RepID=UPI003F4AECD2